MSEYDIHFDIDIDLRNCMMLRWTEVKEAEAEATCWGKQPPARRLQ